MTTIRTVGLLGLGKMGNPMTRHLIAKGFAVVGHDPVPAARDAAAALGARIVSCPRDVAAACDVTIVVVGFDSEIEQALFAADGVVAGAKPGHIVAIGSTCAPRYAQKVAARLAHAGLVMLDIPLTRGEAAAVNGRLLILGAGDEAAFEVCRPALSAFASDIFHLGPAGAGQVGKMVNNMILWACMAANDEGLRLASALGVDPEKLRAALHHSSAQNWSMDTRAENSGMPWAEKDMRIAAHEADMARVTLPVAGVVKEAIKDLKIRLGQPTPAEKE